MNEAPDRSAIVTGGSGAIGAAICARLSRDGWEVYSLDVEPPDSGVAYLEADVTDFGALSRIAERFDRLDLLVNGAGFGDSAPAENMTERQWNRVIDACLTGTFYACRAFYPALAARPGATIANIASTAASNPLELHANYTAAKAGVVALSEVLALEWGRAGIRVFSVSPGFVATPRQLIGLEQMPERAAQIEARTPAGRMLETDEIANAIVELCSPVFAHLTGTDVPIDGGWSVDGGGSRLFR